MGPEADGNVLQNTKSQIKNDFVPNVKQKIELKDRYQKYRKANYAHSFHKIELKDRYKMENRGPIIHFKARHRQSGQSKTKKTQAYNQK